MDDRRELGRLAEDAAQVHLAGVLDRQPDTFGMRILDWSGLLPASRGLTPNCHRILCCRALARRYMYRVENPRCRPGLEKLLPERQRGLPAAKTLVGQVVGPGGAGGGDHRDATDVCRGKRLLMFTDRKI